MRGAFRLRTVRLCSLTILVAAGGCFATRSDVRVVQTDVASLRMEMVRSDAGMRADLTAATALLRAATDSLVKVSARTVSIQGDVRGETRSIREQLLQIQTLLGQSQANINRIRAEMEARNNAAPASGIPPTNIPASSGSTGRPIGAVPGADSASVQGAGPNQLYTNGRDQLQRGSAATARMLFQELLSKYPTSDLAPEAQFYIAESLSREKNIAGADAAYAAVVAKYPDHERAPTALYKRALLLAQQNNMTDARRLFNEVITRYPRTTEAELAADQLKARP